MKAPHKKRVQIAVALLSDLIKQIDELDRAKAVDILKNTYQLRKLEPIRGKSQPPDIYDKEMTTLYVIGKLGLSLHLEYPDLFEKVFFIEETLDSAIEDIMNNNVNEAREKIKKVSSSGVIDSNTIARLLRVPLTKYILGFMTEDGFREILHKVLVTFPEEEKTVRNYARFFIGFKLAESIYKGEIKTRGEKEAYKKALAIRLGFPKSTPGDEYVKAIAESVFNINVKKLSRILRSEPKLHGGKDVEESKKNSTDDSQG